jgi:hypothetical protein
MFEAKLTVGDLLTALAILVSAIGILAELRKDRELKRKEIADRVRRSAGLIVAKVERWMQLSRHLFNEIHPLITDADALLVKDADIVKVRDYFWRELSTLRANITKRIMEEQIEVAYSDLYGYDPRVHELFNGVVDRLRLVDDRVFIGLLQQTQEDILSQEESSQPFSSAALGNTLRSSGELFARRAHDLMENIIAPFRAEMARLVYASDDDIASRRMQFLPLGSLPDVPGDVAPIEITESERTRCDFDMAMARDPGGVSTFPVPRKLV